MVHVRGLKSSIYWTVRSWLCNYPVTSEYPGLWCVGNPNDTENYLQQMIRLVRLWAFLRPFFRSHGYDLFLTNPNDIFAPLLPPSPPSTQTPAFPFAQRFYRQDSDATFLFVAPRVWPARDSEGRDVVIKAVSGLKPHAELSALRKMNTPPLRDHPHNHTIPLLQLLVFHDQVFAIMPRWGAACDGDFETVSQALRYGLAFLQALAFLHKNNLTHGDISVQNMVKDAVAPYADLQYRFRGMRGPERRYAFIDFEAATFGCDQMAYRKDIMQLAAVLERTLLCVADDVPEIAPLLREMKDTAISSSEVLHRFETICNSVPVTILERPTTKVLYSHGTFKYRTITCEDLSLN
ncbi:hypothetical protein BDZ89DRAFT_1138459 [Hymenopellis radicata]|nr:hypothetical protein BDZ89DRAFT_1138459 [Hymenopellis radicata]